MSPTRPDLSRRRRLPGTALLSLGVALLSSCGHGDDEASTAAASDVPTARASASVAAIRNAPVPTSFQVTTSGGAVNDAYVSVRGTAANLAKPMWYEVHQGDDNGRMVDFGAFKANGDWLFVARHLAAGDNIVRVFAQTAAGTIESTALTLTLAVGDAPAVRPRPLPAELWWGGLGDFSELTQPGAQWDFVKKYTDTYFLHSANAPTGDSLRNIAAQFAPYGTKYAVEIGGSTGTDPTWPTWQFNAWGAGGGGYLANRWNQDGVPMSIATHDFNSNEKDFATAHADWSQDQILAAIGAAWTQYFSLNNGVFPSSKHGDTSSPVWWNWRGMPPLGGEKRDLHAFDANGRHYAFDFADVMANVRNAGSQQGHTPFTFFSDAPYYTMVWNEGNNEGAAMRVKIRAYERWLHDQGSRHTFVANEDPGNDQCSNQPAWDAKFATNALLSLQLHQAEGGRADHYLFESWYCGPFHSAPEDQPATWTNIAKLGIKYLKGLRDDGSYMPLSLTREVAGNQVRVTLRNDGDVAALPALVAFEQGAVSWAGPNGEDIGAAIRDAAGWTPGRVIAPGETVTISATTSNSNATIEAFWNPQDPTGRVRARVTLDGDVTGPGLPVGEFHSFQVTTPGFTDRSLHMQAGLGDTQIVTTDSAKRLRIDATFKIVKGLADANCYSFKAKNYRKTFLRHLDFRLRADANDGTQQFKDDATFCARPGLSGSGVSLEAKDLPGTYIRHINSLVWLARSGGSNPWDGNPDSFNQDASWNLVAPWAP